MGNSFNALPICCINRKSLEGLFWDDTKEGSAERNIFDYNAD